MKSEEWIDFLEPEEEDLMQAEVCFQKRKKNRKIPSGKWAVVLAACLLLAGLSVGAFAAQSAGGADLRSWFHADGEKEKRLLEKCPCRRG